MTMAASRDGYGEALLRMQDEERVIVLEADLGKATKSQNFRKVCPERTVSLGISEQNMMLVASGLASSGYIPFASTFAIFTERGFEQVRNGIARPNLAVHICGSHGGIHTGTDGSSAQSIEDLAIYRTLPNMIVMHPCDDVSTTELTMQLLTKTSPSYTRTARNKTLRMYDSESVADLRIGKGSILREGNDVAIIACGVMVARSMEAASILSEKGIEATVVDMHTIKPLDSRLVDELVEKCGALVTVEDHSVIGGLGGSVAEHITSSKLAPLERVGAKDVFGQSGEGDELLDLYGLGTSDICDAAERCIARK